MTKLNQIVATEKALKEGVNKQTAPLFHAAKAPQLFSGLTKTYESIEEGGEELPDETVRVQNTVPELLDAFATPVSKLIDLQLTKETANAGAFADVVVDGQVIIKDAPVTFLLQFEKLLQQEVRGLILQLPVLDPAQTWAPDTSGRLGVSVTEVIKRHRTKKIQKPIVLYAATPEHPAQTQMINEDILAGYWAEKKFSGAISGARKQELLDRVDTLIAAVKYAREAANDKVVEQKAASAAVFGFLFA